MKKDNVKTIDLLKEGILLPPAKDKCQICAVKHEPEQPHDANSLYYKMLFRKENDRWPTWKDALEHCSPDIQSVWIHQLKAHGIEI